MDRESSGSADRIAALEAENARLEAELARLRESERMYRSSAELAAHLVWAADPDGTMVFLDYPFVALTGMSAEEGLATGWYGVLHPDDREPTRLRWRHSLETGEPYLAEYRIRRTDGSYRMTRSRGVAVRGEDGAIRRWYGTTEDIEDEVRTEEARREAVERLRESEQLHRITLEMSQQIAWTAEADGGGLVMSERYQELTGLTQDDQEASQTIHPDDRDRVTMAWSASVASGRPFNLRCRLRMKEGSYRFMRVRASPQRGEDGAILRWYGVTEDIHDQEQAEIAQRDVEERYRLAAQATNDAIWDHDFHDGTIEWSDNTPAILGAATGPLGRTPARWWEERIHPDEALSLIKSLSDAIEGDARRWSGTYRFRRDDGSYADVLDRGFIIRDAQGRAVRAVGAMSDLTERHRAEAEIRRMQAELIHVSRVSAMGTMASTLAHELNQPLAALSNFISGSKRIADNPEVPRSVLVEALGGAEAAAQRAGEILRRLRDMVSRGKVSVGAEHLPQLIEEACVLAFVDEDALGVHHRLDLDPNAAWVRVDRIQIQQVLINLVRNAVEAMAGSAVREVVIATRVVAGNMVEVEVADSGAGIAAEHLGSLFSEFMTTKSGGMGLGLPISRTIVEAHGGVIRAENREAGGASFLFTLPRARRRAQKAQKLPRL
ncbi:MAG: two-component system, LuxR family, sensor kinase FixL [Sphingomonadales bacterium]|jgi:PAS domain S-box-containing protein|nr:two-component system, LuxR family, sensor kinase FixL [Sphingomonadales bacterium]